MPNLTFAAVERDETVPGFTLRVEPDLDYGAVRRGPYVPGVLITDGSDKTYGAALYAYPDLSTPVYDLTGTTYPRTWEWLDMLGETGTGSITVQNDDPLLDELAYDGTDVIIFSFGELRAFAMIVEQSQQTVIAGGEEAAERTTLTGRGLLAILEDAVVYPAAGVEKNPVEEDRHYGWTSPLFDHTAWRYASVLGTVQSAINLGAVLLAGGFNENTVTILNALVSQAQSTLPSLTIPLVWMVDGTLSSADPGVCYFYEEFDVANAGDYRLFFIADDYGEFYLDGAQVGSITGENFLGVTDSVVTLSVGTHAVAARVVNVDNGQTINPGKFGWALATETQVATLLEQSTSWTMVAQTTEACVVLAYPSATPGQTVTKTIRLALEEAQGRGQLVDVECDFTDDLYTDGTPAEAVSDVATKVGTSLLAFLQELGETYVDLAVDVAAGKLRVWAKNGRGDTSSAVFATGTNLLGYDRQREHTKVTRMLVRWTGGWTERESGTGGAEATLEIGAPSSLDEIQRMADGQFDVFGAPRTEITALLAAEDDADMPYLGFLPGDTVTTPDGTEQVKGIAVAISDADLPSVTVTLGDVILDAEERMSRQLRAAR